MTEQLLVALATQAQQHKPRFFAICGVYEYPPVLEGEASVYIEWGMEFPDQGIALTCDQHGQTISSSAEHILKDAVKMGPARLVWLDST